MKTLLKPNWNGNEWRESVSHNDKKFKIVTGLKNGNSGNVVYLITDNGLKQILSRNDIPKISMNTSYVSPESERKVFAETLNLKFKQAIKDLYK